MNITMPMAAAILASAGAGSFLGYQVGTRRLAAVETTLAQTRQTLQTQAQGFQRAQQELTTGAEAIAADHQEEQSRLDASHTRDAQRLRARNADAARQIASLDARIRWLDLERDALHRVGASAPAMQRLAELDTQRAGAADEKAGLACLSVPVPQAQLDALRGD